MRAALMGRTYASARPLQTADAQIQWTVLTLLALVGVAAFTLSVVKVANHG